MSCGLLSDCLLVGTQKLQESQDISVAARLEAAKRRLHERYEQVETGECYFTTIVEGNNSLEWYCSGGQCTTDACAIFVGRWVSSL